MFSDVRNFEELAAPGPTVYMGALMNPAGRPAVTPTLGTYADAMKNSFTDDYSSHGAAVTKAQSDFESVVVTG